ncbi:MAG: hypothetical protein GWN13_26280, partial [Phycisphaerae bacterium]|nr:hypothetical protein [Phycisphaerae bacterium]
GRGSAPEAQCIGAAVIHAPVAQIISVVGIRIVNKPGVFEVNGAAVLLRSAEELITDGNARFGWVKFRN